MYYLKNTKTLKKFIEKYKKIFKKIIVKLKFLMYDSIEIMMMGGNVMTTIPNWFVILMGIGTVFVGLVCIVLLCKILGAICVIIEKQKAAPITTASTPVASVPVSAQTANRQEIIAAIGTAIAEECGVDTSAIRIVSIRKI